LLGNGSSVVNRNIQRRANDQGALHHLFSDPKAHIMVLLRGKLIIKVVLELNKQQWPNGVRFFNCPPVKQKLKHREVSATISPRIEIKNAA
jgi:hypothetical protein